MTAPQDEPVAWMDVGNFDALKGETNGGIQCFLYRSRPYEKSAPLYAQSPAAVRAAAIAECLRIVRDEYVGDGGRLNDQQEGYNDAVYQIDKRLSSLSPRPTVSEEWIREQAGGSYATGRDAIRVAIQSLGYEVKP